MLSKSQIDVLTKYWEKYGGPNFFDPRPFQMFKIKKTSKSMADVGKSYYGEENWKRIIDGFLNQKFQITSPHYIFDYIIKDIDIDEDGEIYHIVVDIDPNGKIKLYNNKLISLSELYWLSSPEEMVEKYFPELEPGSTSYDELIHDLDIDFFRDDAMIYDALEDIILNQLSDKITKPYGAEINSVIPEMGKKEDFEQSSDMTESLFRIKQLIKFSDY